MARLNTLVPGVICGLLALLGCAANTPLLPNGNIADEYNYQVIRPPGQSDADFLATWQRCKRDYPRFASSCMQDEGSSLQFPDGRIMAAKPNAKADNRASHERMCRNFGTEFTQPTEAYNQCMSRLGETVTLANGQVIPPHAAFQTPLVVKPDGAAAVVIAKGPPTPAAKQIIASGDSSAAASTDTSSALQLLLGLAMAAKMSGSAAQGGSAKSSSDGPDPIGGMMQNYGSCGNMWGCW